MQNAQFFVTARHLPKPVFAGQATSKGHLKPATLKLPAVSIGVFFLLKHVHTEKHGVDGPISSTIVHPHPPPIV